jgi:hypothetical protein
VSDKPKLQAGDRVRQRGYAYPFGTIQGFNLRGEAFVVWDDFFDGKGAGLLPVEQLVEVKSGSTTRP